MLRYLSETPSQTAGPYVHIGLIPKQAGFDIFEKTFSNVLTSANTRGEQIKIEGRVFDGTGAQGAQNTSVFVSNWTGPAAAPYPELADLPSGRVRVAFFPRGDQAQQPDYEVGMRYWTNGVADELNMGFSDFVLGGKLTSFSVAAQHC